MPTKIRSGLKHDPPIIESDKKDSVEPGVKWEKALWRKQPFPDNYVPPSFLTELKALRKFELHDARTRGADN
jgi:hypothetical protein